MNWGNEPGLGIIRLDEIIRMAQSRDAALRASTPPLPVLAKYYRIAAK
jgi:hypothetical protein